jgi:small subunit ribosomal protein S6
MSKNALMNKYELVVIVNAALSEDAKQEILKTVTDTVTKSGGKVINSQVWFDKHKLTFSIKKIKEATYYLINFEGEGDTANKVSAVLRLNEKVLRFGIYSVE